MMIQKSKVKWTREGDFNSRYFHGVIKGRARRQRTMRGFLNIGFNFENLNKQLTDARAESQIWKRAWDIAMSEQEEINGALKSQVFTLERWLT